MEDEEEERDGNTSLPQASWINYTREWTSVISFLHKLTGQHKNTHKDTNTHQLY